MAEPKFEKDLERLEKVVEALEEGGLSLDDALKKFEEGVKLAKRCEQALNAAEKRIDKLTKTADGKFATEPFEDESAAKSEDSEDASSCDEDDEESGDESEDGEDEDKLLF